MWTSIFLNLNWFLTLRLWVAVWPSEQCAWCTQALAFEGLLLSPTLEILFIICGEAYCLEILVFISPLALTDTQGEGGGKHLVLFYDMPWSLC